MYQKIKINMSDKVEPKKLKPRHSKLVCKDCKEEFYGFCKRHRCNECDVEYKKEWRRNYHRKDMFKRRQEKYNERSFSDIEYLKDNYMVGLGTIKFSEFDGDFEKEWRVIRAMARGIITRDE